MVCFTGYQYISGGCHCLRLCPRHWPSQLSTGPPLIMEAERSRAQCEFDNGSCKVETASAKHKQYGAVYCLCLADAVSTLQLPLSNSLWARLRSASITSGGLFRDGLKTLPFLQANTWSSENFTFCIYLLTYTICAAGSLRQAVSFGQCTFVGGLLKT